MAKFVIQGGRSLKGEISVSGNKNSILPVMAATLLASEECVLENVPQIGDVLAMGEILRSLGAKVAGLGTHQLVINPRPVKSYQPSPDLVAKLRASILLFGPLLARFGKAKMRHPGGCVIGRRAVGTHFDALEELGAKTITTEQDYDAKAEKLKNARIFLDEVSVTATENAMMMASLIPGETIIDDAACEPHVVDLANFLNLLGAEIKGAGTNRIIIQGVKKLKGGRFSIGPDFMDVSAFAIAGAATRGRLIITNIRPDDLTMILLYFQRMNIKYQIAKDRLTVFPSEVLAPKGKVQTRPWPGFPTDVMSPFIVLATQAKGITLCHDWMYESRMFFVDKLVTMGANITLCDPHRVLIYGPTKLRGKVLDSPDIRAGMALVIAALCAEGESTINNIEMIERGFENIESRLRSLGARIKRIE